MNPTSQATALARNSSAKKAKPWQRLLPLLITLACFAYLYNAPQPRRYGRRHRAAHLPGKKL